MDVGICKIGPADLGRYESVGIGFQVSSKVSLPHLRASGGSEIVEIPTPSRWKDYDDSAMDRPTALPEVWDMSNWLLLSAMDSEVQVGGAIVARATPKMDMLEGRDDLALIVDIRVRDDCRGKGVGRALFYHLVSWARQQACRELRVETQDVNVAACRFYSTVGFDLCSVEEHGYEGSDEAKLIWQMML